MANIGSIYYGSHPTCTNIILLYGDIRDEHWGICSYWGLHSVLFYILLVGV